LVDQIKGEFSMEYKTHEQCARTTQDELVAAYRASLSGEDS
jgi:hypothetical protein